MELVVVLCVSLAAVAAAVLIGERLDKTVFLKWEVKDMRGLQRQLREVAQKGIGFGEECYTRGWVPLEQVEEIAMLYVKDIMANYYKTTIIEQEGTLEQVIEDAILTEDKV
jgi:hypothetical protein